MQLTASSFESLLGTVYQTGASAWPGLSISATIFIGYVAERLGPRSEPLENALRALRSGDLYLACACVYGIGDALQRFDAAFISRVPAFLGHMRLPASFVEDVQQELRRKYLVWEDAQPPTLASYEGRGELANWVRAAAVRTAISLRRRKDEQAERDDGSMAEQMAGGSADPEIESLKRRYSGDFKCALEAAITALPAEHRNLLRLYFVDRLTTTQIGATFGINQSSASRRLIAIREALLDSTKRLLRDRLKLSDSAFQELSGLVQSQLHLSLSRILR